MVIDTKKRETKYYVFLGIFVLLAALFYHIRSKPDFFYGRYGELIDSLFLLEINIVLAILLILYRPSHFYYNDTDQVVIIRSKRIFLGNILFKRNINLDLPKRKIRRVRIEKKIFRPYLSITINSKRSVKRTRSIDMILLTKSEREKILEQLISIASNQNDDEQYGRVIRK
jgi:hypothetical protein